MKPRSISWLPESWISYEHYFTHAAITINNHCSYPFSLQLQLTLNSSTQQLIKNLYNLFDKDKICLQQVFISAYRYSICFIRERYILLTAVNMGRTPEICSARGLFFL